MVSKNQRFARKRFKEANPDLFPKNPEPSDENPTSKMKKKSKNKPKTLKPKSNNNKKKSGNGSKHPLRVPGMRPGESCFICKSADHIAKSCPEKSQWEKNKICLLCRHRGHSLKNCPQKSKAPAAEKSKFCYNCGESGHSLSKCPLPLKDGGTKFANCFICNEQGHLSKNCPKNTHGIYPKGGCCKVCGGVTHLAKDCPNKGMKNSTGSNGFSAGNLEGKAQGKRTVFHSGDDLEDDFMMEDNKDGKDVPSHSNSGPATVEGKVEKYIQVKPKKKQGPKVVNFFG